MFIQYVERSIYNVQLEKLDWKFVCSFYFELDCKNIALMVYDGDEYYTNITYEEISRYSEEKEWIYFLRYACESKKYIEVSNKQQTEAVRIFRENPDFVYLLLKNSDRKEKAVFVSYIDISNRYHKTLEDIRFMLRNKQINSYLVGIPTIQDILEEKRHPEWKGWGFCDKINWSVYNRSEMNKYLYKFTERNYDVARRDLLNKGMHETHYGREDRTIFVVGPCIVAGYENFWGESLGDILYKQLQQQRLPYEVECVITCANIKSKLTRILEFDIQRNDIVLLITDCSGGQ